MQAIYKIFVFCVFDLNTAKLGHTPSLHSVLAESNAEMHLKFYDTALLMRSTVLWMISVNPISPVDLYFVDGMGGRQRKAIGRKEVQR